TLFAPLTAHIHHPGIQIYVSPVNARSLGNPQTAIGTQRYCSTNLRLTSLITSFQRSHKVTAAYWTRKLIINLRRIKTTCRIIWPMVLTSHPPIESAKTRKLILSSSSRHVVPGFPPRLNLVDVSGCGVNTHVDELIQHCFISTNCASRSQP